MAYALITGAAKGIGRAIAEEMAARNYNLLLVDIDEAGLARTAQELNDKFTQFILTLTLDLSKRDAAESLWKWTQPYHKDLNIVINNAGYGLNGPFEKMGIDEQLNIIDVNIRAQLTIAHTFIPLLKT
ncbi:MAG TPA: SDR family NAD(P)-dependent oxidoreductase, partial [Chitinophagaceae bacterium]|nr:SDR family NAD(P)-dependent oxidoreductase [Chitinophagaceae bacterium]